MTTSLRDPDLARLQRIMARLRGPDGCPWDHQQSLETLRHYLLEEAHEVLEVMTGTDSDAHCEELGDLLLQIVFQAQLRSEHAEFQLADVVDRICDKMVRRHPHVFGDENARDAGAVAARWEEIKRAEGKAAAPAAVTAHLPALMRAEKVGARAAKVGFDWPDVSGPIAKVREELGEVESALAHRGDHDRVHDEIGDLLFAVVNVARHLGVRPELALHDASARFVRRFDHVVHALGECHRRPEDASVDELDRLWEAAKRDERGA